MREKFAEDIKWAGEKGIASVAEGEIRGEICFNRRVDSSRVDLQGERDLRATGE